MSEEEMKAVDYWKNYMEILHWNTQLASEHHMKVLLDLIEKQSKEIEELKKQDLSNSKIIANMSTRHFNDREKIRKYEELQDKIKAKIEKLDEEIKVKREIAKNPMDIVSGRLLTDSIVELEKAKSILQSLLNEEE